MNDAITDLWLSPIVNGTSEYTPRLCTLTSVKVEPVYTRFEWDWLEDGLCCFALGGYTEATPNIFEILRDTISDVSARPTSDHTVLVSYYLVVDGDDEESESEYFEVTISRDPNHARTFTQHMPSYPLFDHIIYSPLTMFAYDVAQVVWDNSSFQSVQDEW